MFFSVLFFPRRPADVGTENIQDGLTQVFGILRQMKKLVGTTQTHGVGLMPQVFNGVFQAFLPLPLFGILIGFCLLFGSFGLRVRGFFHCLGACMRSQGL